MVGDAATHGALYEFLKDQGGFIGAVLGGAFAGGFTLWGGYLAYSAGQIQAAKTIEAAKMQVAAIKDQMAQELAVITDRDRRATKALVSGLAGEAARLKMIVEEQLRALNTLTGGNYSGTMPRQFAVPYSLEADVNLRAALIGDADVAKKVSDAALVLYARIDQLNALVMVRAHDGGLAYKVLQEAIFETGEAAKELQKETALALV